jgi:DNA-binding protein
MNELPIAPVKRIVHNNHTGRVSDNAAAHLAKVLDEKGDEIARKAVELAKHAGRKTVRADDIELAVKILSK